MAEIDITGLREWVGRGETVSESITAAPAAALAATFDHAAPPGLGTPLPPLWHWIYFTPRAPQAELGVDGHPRLGGFMPPIPLPRRMWAGGRLIFHDALLIGEDAEKRTEIMGLSAKQGRQGALIFVTLRHLFHTVRGLAIEEEQDLVYRPTQEGASAGAGESGRPLTEEPRPAEWRDTIDPDPTLLFRYSALTFNAHRIHYDLAYAQTVEGYPGLVVQGPLTATLLVDRLLAHRPGRLVHFAFRGRAPLFAGSSMRLCGGGTVAPGAFALWAESADGSVAMTASAQLEASDAD